MLLQEKLFFIMIFMFMTYACKIAAETMCPNCLNTLNIINIMLLGELTIMAVMISETAAKKHFIFHIFSFLTLTAFIFKSITIWLSSVSPILLTTTALLILFAATFTNAAALSLIKGKFISIKLSAGLASITLIALTILSTYIIITKTETSWTSQCGSILSAILVILNSAVLFFSYKESKYSKKSRIIILAKTQKPDLYVGEFGTLYHVYRIEQNITNVQHTPVQ